MDGVCEVIRILVAFCYFRKAAVVIFSTFIHISIYKELLLLLLLLYVFVSIYTYFAGSPHLNRNTALSILDAARKQQKLLGEKIKKESNQMK